jgi:hypothetical protein
MAGKRFAHHSELDLQSKKLVLIPQNTRKSNEKAAKSLRLYLAEKGENTNFEEFSAAELNKVLKTFYFDARTITGELYKASTLENLRHSLNRFLKAPPHSRIDLDIIKDPRFTDANESYKAAIKELKSVGKGTVDHYEKISESELRQIYRSFDTNTAKGLADKVQFDVRLYFCRRGNENMNEMTKETFGIKTNPTTNVRYVYKKMDELNKNHREIGESYSGYMPESPGNSSCPVRSFEKMLSVSL